jgi:hypothetical protein
VEGDLTDLPTWLEQALDAAHHGSYFACLGLGPDAATTEVRDAYRARVEALDAARPLAALLPGGVATVELVARVLEDAFEVLVDPDRRLAYRRALEA